MADCADGDAVAFEGVLEGKGIDDGGEHAGVVAGGAVHAGRRGFGATEDVAAADDDGDFDAELLDGFEFAGDDVEHGGVDAVRAISLESLAAEFQEDTFEGRGAGHGQGE